MISATSATTEQLLENDVYRLVESVVYKYKPSRSKLIAILQDIQREVGYLPRHALEAVSSKLGVPLSEVLAVASFYHQFKLEPTGTYVFQVCYGTACYLRGAGEVYEALRLAAKSSQVHIEKVRCFGCCSLAPVVMVVNVRTGERSIHGRLTPAEARKLVQKYTVKEAGIK